MNSVSTKWPRYVAGALLAIPALSQLLARIGSDTLIAFRYWLLAEFTSVEARVHGYRRQMLVLFSNGIAAFVAVALQLLGQLSGFATGYIRSIAAIGVDYLRGVLEGVSAFDAQLGTFWTDVTGIIRRLVAFGEAIVAMDLGDVVHQALTTVQHTVKSDRRDVL